MPGGTLLVATLGFHENFALRMLNQLGAGEGDYVAALTVKPPARAVMTAWRSLSTLASRLGVRPLELREADPSDFEALVAEIVEWLDSTASSLGVERLVIEATGGARILTAAALLAAIPLSTHYNVDYIIQSDTGEDWQARVTGSLIDVILNPPTPRRLAIIKAVLEEPGATPQRVAEKTGIHPKTVMNALTDLKKHGILIQKGRNRGVYPTSRAKLALYLAEHKPT